MQKKIRTRHDEIQIKTKPVALIHGNSSLKVTKKMYYRENQAGLFIIK